MKLRLSCLAALCLLSACAAPPPAPAPAPAAAEQRASEAERALSEGVRAYDNGQYPAAEAALRRALDGALPRPQDQALAHKLLAFITCTSAREAACEAHFRAARAADPGFALTRAEAGHPMWGPVADLVFPPLP